MKIKLFMIFLLLPPLVYAQKYRTEKHAVSLELDVLKITQYYDNGRIYRRFYEKDGVRDSLYFRWNNRGNLVREGLYRNGKKTGLWKQWYFEEKTGYDYREELYNHFGILQHIASYWIRNKKNILLNKVEYIIKGDTTIKKTTDWYSSLPGQIMRIGKVIKVNQKFLIQESKTWSKEGWMFRETLYTEDGKNTIVFEREWNKQQKVQETWTRKWKEVTVDGFWMREKLFRRKTYQNGKLVKDEKFE